VGNHLLLLIQVMLLFYHLYLAGSVSFLFSFFGRLPLGFGVTSIEAAAALDAAAADANRVSFFFGTILLPINPTIPYCYCYYYYYYYCCCCYCYCVFILNFKIKK
jgi:hypothetical protein